MIRGVLLQGVLMQGSARGLTVVIMPLLHLMHRQIRQQLQAAPVQGLLARL